jgi:hypothetical protein
MVPWMGTTGDSFMKNLVAKGSPPFINAVLSIDEWKEYVASYDFGSIPPSRVVLHHTWKPTVAQWRGLASMQGMQSFYRSKGWSSAPHIYVAPDGIWLATPMREVGIHAGSGNSGNWGGKWSYSIGLEMVGNYDKQRPSGAVWEGSKAVLGELSKRLNIAPRQLIYFHRDFSTKSCPGWAVTKDWVWGEVEAYVNNAKPPKPPAIGKVGTPTPEQETLMESLLNESYAKRADGYTSEWAFHQFAVQHGLGMPMAKSARITVEGKEYSFQPFARDTLFNEVPKWGEVQQLSTLLGGSIPPSGLGRVLLEETYKACGATFHADWAFHQFAMSAKLGPPIGESGKLNIENKEYSYQVFAADTLYNLVPNWSDVKQLSTMKEATPLREALLHATYKNAGATYHPDWAFHQMAIQLEIGSPLSDSQKLKVGGSEYSFQVYALDTLYNLVPNWSDVKRLKDLAHAEGMPSFGLEMAVAPTVTGTWEPPALPSHQVMRYSQSSPSFSDRGATNVSMVMIHGDPGESMATLERMTTIGALDSVHYYITADGAIYQLVDEAAAAWHSGMATMGGLWFDTNSISVGIMLERMPVPIESHPDLSARTSSAPGAEDRKAQISALRWLLGNLVAKYHLSPDDVILSSSICSNNEHIPPDLLLTDVFAR